jgi:hypothetical protein
MAEIWAKPLFLPAGSNKIMGQVEANMGSVVICFSKSGIFSIKIFYNNWGL